MPITRFADLPIVQSILFGAVETEVSLTLSGQCFGLQIGVGGSFKKTQGNDQYVHVAFESGLVVPGTDCFTLYASSDGVFQEPQNRYQNYGTNSIRIPRNKFVRDLTVYAATFATGNSVGVRSLQVIYWTTPTP